MQKLKKVTRCFVLLALGLPRLTLVVVWLNHELCISKPQVTAQLCPGWILLSLLVLVVWRVIEWLPSWDFCSCFKSSIRTILTCALVSISTWYVWTRMQRVDNWHPVGRIEDDLSLWQASRARQGWDGMGWWGLYSSQLFCQASAVLCLTCQCNARLATTLVQAYNTAHYVWHCQPAFLSYCAPALQCQWSVCVCEMVVPTHFRIGSPAPSSHGGLSLLLAVSIIARNVVSPLGFTSPTGLLRNKYLFWNVSSVFIKFLKRERRRTTLPAIQFCNEFGTHSPPWSCHLLSISWGATSALTIATDITTTHITLCMCVTHSVCVRGRVEVPWHWVIFFWFACHSKLVLHGNQR